ncbi:MAG: sigma-70 family RNA polymerase sigma factor [Crocinitomicaceae bacterium]
MTQPLDDSEILQQFSQGGAQAEGAFRALVDQYGPALYRQIRGMAKSHELTNDILQDVFVKVYQNLATFKGDSALTTWMFRIARNETLNFLQKEQRRSGVDLDAPVLEIKAGHASLDQIDGETISQLLEDAIESLPDKQATVFQLKYFEELPYYEISKRLGTSEGALKASFFHAKKKIEEFVLNKLNH